MRRRAKRWSAVNDLLGGALKRVAPPRELAGYAVWAFWSEEVGAMIARNAQPSRFRNGVLVVTVANHSWIQDLQFMKEGIRDKLNARLGGPVIRDIQLECGKVIAPPASAPRPRRLEGQTPVIEVPAINDGALRDAFARLLDARARRLQSGRKRSP